jgi:fructose-bisphosphate aldolase, class II
LPFYIKKYIIKLGDNMIENAINILKQAQDQKYAIPQFNINNLEWTKYVLEECNLQKAPVILGVSEGAIKYMGGYNVVTMMIKGLVKDLKISIPVIIHLDHASSVESCKNAIDAGFTSVMIDASKYPLHENILITQEVVQYAKMHNVSVEAEVGHIGGTEDTVIAEIAYAKVDDCIKIVNETNIDMLAPALGSVHGLYVGEPKLDFDRMKEIGNKISVPLVLHGGSGIPDDMIKKAIELGTCKINVNTELQIAWHEAVKKYINDNPNQYDPRKVIKSGETAIKKAIFDKLTLFKTINRG